MKEYEQQDYDVAKKAIDLGFFMDLDKKTLASTETNIIDIAKKYYTLRLRTFNPDTGEHL